MAPHCLLNQSHSAPPGVPDASQGRHGLLVQAHVPVTTLTLSQGAYHTLPSSMLLLMKCPRLGCLSPIAPPPSLPAQAFPCGYSCMSPVPHTLLCPLPHHAIQEGVQDERLSHSWVPGASLGLKDRKEGGMLDWLDLRQPQATVLAQPLLPGCSQFPHLYNGDNMSASDIGLLR